MPLSYRRAAARTRGPRTSAEATTIDMFRSWAAEGKHVILSSHVLQEVDVISDQVVLIANGMIVAEGQIRKVRDEIDEHPSQFIVRCRDGDASGVAET